MLLKTRYLVIAAFAVLGLFACQKWDDHNSLKNDALGQSLFDVISSRSNLSKFKEYLVKTGLDKELASSKSYTVWAPTNDALAGIDAAVVADTAKLRQYIGNHIANGAYYTRMADTAMRIAVLNGKRTSFFKKTYEEATITEADITAGNGVLMILDKAAAPKLNIWEYINTTTANYKQNAFVATQNYLSFNPSLAIIDSISSTTGLPVYRPGTGLVSRNLFLDATYDVRDESKQYTYFVMADAGWNTEVGKLAPYYATSTTDSTTRLSSSAVIRDVVVTGLYTPDKLPDTLISKNGVRIPVTKSNIMQTQAVSNGIVYVMSGIDFKAKDKIPTLIVEGENPREFLLSTGVATSVNNRFVRVRMNPLTGKIFNDLFIYNHGISALAVKYSVTAPSVKYKVYWVTANDTSVVTSTIVPVAFMQRLAMGTQASATFAYRTVAIKDYAETYLGDYIKTTYGTLDMFLTAAASTSAGANTLSLDYIKLVPDIQ